ncbi:MAG: hypothetical protein HYZ16_00715, partial [Bacteroidetes bacterium]|nr:hypothetical protein [Bacteroidota bacterium]
MSNFYSMLSMLRALLLCGFFTSALTFTAYAQVNYALSATATQSDNRASPYDAGNYNDNVIAAAGSTPWGWLSCSNTSGYSAWVQYEWKSKVSVNKVHFYNVLTTTRCMTAAEIQYWDGSNWKKAGSFSVSASVEVEYEFPTVTTTKLRFTNFYISGSQQSNPNWREIQVFHISYGPNDAGVASIDSPFAFCGGTQPIVVTVQNYGINQIDTLTINWELDGTAQTPVVYTGVLDTAGGKGNTYAQVKLGTASFAGERTLKVWTSKPNNVADTVPDNDTVFAKRKPSLAGRFTIGTNGDYKSFSAAAADLSAYGVCGPVEFIVRPGTYTEQVTIKEMVGASATNTVTFKSAHIDSVTLQYTASASGQNTLTLEGADYVRFHNMRILANGSTYGWAVHLTGAADYNSFTNCVIQASLSSSSSSSIALVASGSSTSYSTSGNNANYNTFTDCQIRGGYFNCVMYGGGTTAPIKGNSFYNCKFEQAYYYGAYIYYSDQMVFHDNVIKDQRNTYNYGMMFYYASNFDIQRNYAKCTYYSSLYYANNYNYNGKVRSTYANNVLISTGTSYSLYGYYMSYTNFHHNSLYGKGSYLCYWYYMNNNDIRNNIFYYEGTSYVIYTYNPTFVEWDYNDYYKTGGNLAYISGSVYANAAALKGWNPGANQHNWELDPAWVQKDEDHHLTSSFPNMFGPYVGV